MVLLWLLDWTRHKVVYGSNPTGFLVPLLSLSVYQSMYKSIYQSLSLSIYQMKLNRRRPRSPYWSCLFQHLVTLDWIRSILRKEKVKLQFASRTSVLRLLNRLNKISFCPFISFLRYLIVSISLISSRLIVAIFKTMVFNWESRTFRSGTIAVLFGLPALA